MVSIAVLTHSPGVVYYHLLLRQETRIPGVAPFSFRIGIWDLFVHRGQTSYTPTAFGKLWTAPGVRCMKHAHHNPCPRYETGPGIKPGTFGLADECSTTELTLLLIYQEYRVKLQGTFSKTSGNKSLIAASKVGRLSVMMSRLCCCCFSVFFN